MAAIPAGVTGVSTLQQFSATAGKQNICNTLQYASITPQTQRESALLSAHFAVTESTDLFSQLLFSDQHLHLQLGPLISVSQGTVAANNPYDPFGEAVNVSFAYPGAGEPEVTSKSWYQAVVGVRGSVFSDWRYEATAYLSRDKTNNVRTSTDDQLIANALASSDPATALNPFTSGPLGTPQLVASLNGSPFVEVLDNQIVTGQGILRGPVLQLPTGAVQVVIGGEYSQQREEVDITNFGTTTPFVAHRNSYSAFGEARVPLLGDRTGSKERLSLSLAGRYDHSDDYGGKATGQGGLLWRPIETISLRAGYGVSYRAPQLQEISGPQNSFSFPLFAPDPFRGGQLITYPVTFISGPNSGLKPETGDTFTLGLEYSSQALPGLHTSLTWYDLKITNYIGQESIGTLLSYPTLFPGAVTRAPATAQDQQQGYLGVVQQLDYTYYNFGDLRVSGVSGDISYAIETRAGVFTPSLAISNIYRWQSAILPNAPSVDGVSNAIDYLAGVGWAPRWKGTAALSWKQGPVSMGIAGRYIGRYLDYQLAGLPPNTNEIGNTWIVDFNARYGIGQALARTNPWLAQSYVAFGVVNLLNKTPPFSNNPDWYDTREYDLRGRYVHLSAGVRF
jgi:iron complex outermembrane receptor protein